MPPKPKFTKEEIVSVALDLVREKGMEALTARELGIKLGSSARPIFTVFKNMDEVAEQVKLAAMDYYNDFISDAVNYFPAFKQYGIRMIQFAKNEPKLFQLIFMQERSSSVNFDDLIFKAAAADFCVDIIENQYGIDKESAKIIYRQALLSNYGICCMIAANVCPFSEKEIDEYLGASFAGALMYVKSNNRDYFKIHPEKKGESIPTLPDTLCNKDSKQ